MTPSKSFTSRTAIAFVFRNAAITGKKSILPSPTALWVSFLAVLVVNVHVGEAGLEEFGQAVVEIRVPAIKGKAGVSDEPDIVRGPQVEEVHVPHVLKAEVSERSAAVSRSSSRDFLNCRSASSFSWFHA